MLPTTKFTPQAKVKFLEVLEDTCSVKAACLAVGISRNLAYIHRKQDQAFSQDWDQAVERALDDLLGVAYQRSTEERSDQVLITLLRFRYGEQMKERLAIKVEQSTGLSAESLLLMTAEDRQSLRELLGKYSQIDQATHQLPAIPHEVNHE